MSLLLVLSGSPSPTSRTALAAGLARERLTALGHEATELAVRDLPAADLLSGRTGTPELSAALERVAAADGVIVATPLYKAAYTGLLKGFLDLLPPDGLAGKAVFPLVTGGTLAHLLAIDYALRPVLASLRARHVVQGCFLLDSSIGRTADGRADLDPESVLRLHEGVDEFAAALPAAARIPAPAPPAPAGSAHTPDREAPVVARLA